MPTYRDPDDTLVVLFKYLAMENPGKSLAEGRPIFDDVEVCEIRQPGSRDVKVFPSTAISHWVVDPHTGEQRQQSYAERFAHQYRQFKASAAQTITGTPLDLAPFLTDGRRAELRAQNVYTVEQLAAIDGNELKNLGPNGRDFKNHALAFIEEARTSAPNKQMAAELEALRARNAVLEDDVTAMKAAHQRADQELEEMSDEQLRDYVTANTGKTPVGTLPRKQLKRMAMEATGKAA
jgi:hypothetical protein